jgi:uridine kinase
MGTLVAIAGGSCSGKSFLAEHVARAAGGEGWSPFVLCLDRYYVGIERMRDDNFDHPDAVDLAAAWRDVDALLRRRPTDLPVYRYDATNHRRLEITERVSDVDLLIVEGLFALSSMPEEIRSSAVQLFVETSPSDRLQRRLQRDRDLGITEQDALRMWQTQAEPMFDLYVRPSAELADLTVSGGGSTSLEAIWTEVRILIQETSASGTT